MVPKRYYPEETTQALANNRSGGVDRSGAASRSSLSDDATRSVGQVSGCRAKFLRLSGLQGASIERCAIGAARNHRPSTVQNNFGMLAANGWA